MDGDMDLGGVVWWGMVGLLLYGLFGPWGVPGAFVVCGICGAINDARRKKKRDEEWERMFPGMRKR